jgi:hypothetical protein
MSFADALAESAAKPAGKRPYFFESREAERVLAITMAVAQELAVTRDRLDTVERLLAAKGILLAEEIELFRPDPAAAAARGLQMQEYLVRILRIVQQEGEAARQSGEVASEDVASELAGED